MKAEAFYNCISFLYNYLNHTVIYASTLTCPGFVTVWYSSFKLLKNVWYSEKISYSFSKTVNFLFFTIEIKILKYIERIV